MKNRFSNELSRTLSDFVRKSSDDELRQAFEEADYAFYSDLDFEVTGLLGEEFREEMEVATFTSSLVGVQLSSDWLDHPSHPICVSDQRGSPQIERDLTEVAA